VGELFGFIDRFSVVDVFFESEDTLDEVYDPDKPPLEGSRDVFVHEESPSLGFNDSVLPNPLDHSHASPLCSLSSPSPEHYIDAPVDNIMICDANMN